MSDRYIVVCGLEGLVEHAINNANTIEDLSRYLSADPHPDYRIVSCNFIAGRWNIVFERA